MGGGAMPTHPMLPVINPGLVSPLVYVTGNPRTYEKSPENFDFDASAIMTEARPVEEVGEKLLELLLDIASGTMTKAETLDYDEQLEMYLEGPVL